MLDTNILIFAELENCPEHSIAVRKHLQFAKHHRFATNVVIISELFHFLQQNLGSEIAAERISDILAGGSIEFLDIGAATLNRAAKLARDFRMQINDAIIAQQAIDTGVAIFTDDVRDFSKLRSILQVYSLRQD